MNRRAAAWPLPVPTFENKSESGNQKTNAG